MKKQIFLGDDDFVMRMQQQLDKQSNQSEVTRVQHRPKAKPLNDYACKDNDRRKSMTEAYATGDYTMKEIAAYFNVHYSTVSRAIKKAQLIGV